MLLLFQRVGGHGLHWRHNRMPHAIEWITHRQRCGGTRTRFSKLNACDTMNHDDGVEFLCGRTQRCAFACVGDRANACQSVTDRGRTRERATSCAVQAIHGEFTRWDSTKLMRAQKHGENAVLYSEQKHRRVMCTYARIHARACEEGATSATSSSTTGWSASSCDCALFLPAVGTNQRSTVARRETV